MNWSRVLQVLNLARDSGLKGEKGDPVSEIISLAQTCTPLNYTHPCHETRSRPLPYFTFLFSLSPSQGDSCSSSPSGPVSLFYSPDKKEKKKQGLLVWHTARCISPIKHANRVSLTSVHTRIQGREGRER